MRSSIRDVARRAGVSPMTVSNVLRRRTGRLSEETRQRVLEALQELNYIPIRPAMQNRHVTTHAIGVVFLQNMRGQVGQRTFWGMAERARELDHDLLIILRSQPNWLAPDMAAQFLDRRCDGYVIVGAYQPALSAMLVAQKVPVVECYSVYPPPGVARVVGDDHGAMHQAVAELWAAGHRRIAHLGGPTGDGEADARCDGFRAAMAARGGESELIVRGDTWGGAAARPLAEQVLKLGVTAAVCANDALALELWAAAEVRGLRVPHDFSVTGMDNTQEAGARGLTSLSVSYEQIGRVAVDALLGIVDGKETDTAAVPAELVGRRSVAPPPWAGEPEASFAQKQGVLYETS